MDYDIQHNAKCCSVTGRTFVPGETYYSAVVDEGSELKRYDFGADAWKGPPEDAVGWWKTQIPDRTSMKKRWAPNELMLDFWDKLADEPERQDMRYVLTLLLVRRRVLRLDEENRDSTGGELLVVYCPRRETSYEIPVLDPPMERIGQIQEELAALLQ
jgi:hypothetical protein